MAAESLGVPGDSLCCAFDTLSRPTLDLPLSVKFKRYPINYRDRSGFSFYESLFGHWRNLFCR